MMVPWTPIILIFFSWFVLFSLRKLVLPWRTLQTFLVKLTATVLSALDVKEADLIQGITFGTGISPLHPLNRVGFVKGMCFSDAQFCNFFLEFKNLAQSLVLLEKPCFIHLWSLCGSWHNIIYSYVRPHWYTLLRIRCSSSCSKCYICPGTCDWFIFAIELVENRIVEDFGVCGSAECGFLLWQGWHDARDRFERLHVWTV